MPSQLNPTEPSLGGAPKPSGEARSARSARRKRDFRSYVDTGFMALKVLIAGAFVSVGFVIRALPEASVIGVLPSSAYAHTLGQARDTAQISIALVGGYVILSVVVGLIGRMVRLRSLYSMYWCSNVLGVSICLAATILPTLWATAKDSYCQVAQSECSRVADPLQCPFNLPSSSRLAVPPRGTRLLSVSGGDAAWLEAVHSSRLRGDTTSTGAIDIRALEMSGHDRRLPAIGTSGRESTAKCCYTQEVVDTCERYFGAFWLLCVVGSSLTLLVAFQSSVSCCLLCFSRELDGLHSDEFPEWGGKGLPTNGPQEERVVIATEDGRRGAMHEDSKAEDQVEAGGEMRTSTVHEVTTSGPRE